MPHVVKIKVKDTDILVLLSLVPHICSINLTLFIYPIPIIYIKSFTLSHCNTYYYKSCF